VRITATLIAAGLLVAAVGCGTSIQTNYDYDVNANFAQYGTYNWIPQPEAKAGSAQQARQRNDLLDKRIKNRPGNATTCWIRESRTTSTPS